MVPGGMELGIILLMVLIIFGPGKLPQSGRSMDVPPLGKKDIPFIVILVLLMALVAVTIYYLAQMN